MRGNLATGRGLRKGCGSSKKQSSSRNVAQLFQAQGHNMNEPGATPIRVSTLTQNTNKMNITKNSNQTSNANNSNNTNNNSPSPLACQILGTLSHSPFGPVFSYLGQPRPQKTTPVGQLSQQVTLCFSVIVNTQKIIKNLRHQKSIFFRFCSDFGALQVTFQAILGSQKGPWETIFNYFWGCRFLLGFQTLSSLNIMKNKN